MARQVFKVHKAIMPDPIPDDLYRRRTAINKIYEALTDAETGADISGIMLRIQKIVDESIENQLEQSGLNTGTVIDLSKLDFDLVRKLFDQSRTKNTDTQTFKQAVEEKLQEMIRQNPLRIDFYVRYQEIIEEYNHGKNRATVEKTFADLMDLMSRMSEEEQRVKREGLTEEQAAIFDLLLKPELAAKDRNKVKGVAVELLQKLKEEPLKTEYWSEKTTAVAEVKNVINMYLYQYLPEPYSEKDVDAKTGQLYNHIRSNYYGAGRSAYTA
jgi:type I restriction enzyme R subunit